MTTTELLGKYEIRATLGQGAMGIVYDGWDPVIERRVAIKTVRLPPATDTEAQEELARFKREAQAAGRLNHPNIVGVFDYGETDKVAFIVMEFVDGRTLKQALEAGERMTPPEIARRMYDILNGLQYSHNRGVVHRDIKPANIMITREGRAKIADFGIARIENSNLTQAGTLLGTPAYMSPEQFSGQVVDLRTDIYSAGVMLYQLLTGERPFDGSMTAIMHKVLNTTPPKPSDISVTCPKSLDAVVARAMAKRPDDRFDNADAFADAIHVAIDAPAAPPPAAERPVADGERTIVSTQAIRPAAPDPASDDTISPVSDPLSPFLEGAPLATRPTASATDASARPEPVATAPPVPPAKRSRAGALIAAGVAIAGVAAGGGYFLTRGQGGGPATANDRTASATTASSSQATPPRPDMGDRLAPADAGGRPPVTMPITEAVIPGPPVAKTPPDASAIRPPVVTPPVVTPPVITPPVVTPVIEPPRPTTPDAATSGSTAPVVVPPIEPPKPDLATVLQNAQCALVHAGAANGSEPVSISGIASAQALAALQPSVVSAVGTMAVAWRVRAFDGPYCDAIDAIRPAAIIAGGVSAKSNKPFLRDDDLLTIDVTFPDYPSHLTIDYFSSDGSVAHLVPTTPDVKDHSDPDRVYPARAHETFGKPIAQHYAGLRVGEPFGTDMIVVTASAAPLLPIASAQGEDKSAAYVAELQAAIASARKRGEKVTATAFVLEVAPKK